MAFPTSVKCPATAPHHALRRPYQNHPQRLGHARMVVQACWICYPAIRHCDAHHLAAVALEAAAAPGSIAVCNIGLTTCQPSGCQLTHLNAGFDSEEDRNPSGPQQRDHPRPRSRSWRTGGPWALNDPATRGWPSSRCCGAFAAHENARQRLATGRCTSLPTG